jgi:anti-anti-sigma factor
MALGVSQDLQGVRREGPRDRCSYPRPFAPDFAACPAFQATTFIAADSEDRELHTHRTCDHLEIGTHPSQAGRFYPRCVLGDPGQRRRWVARVSLERLEVVRALQEEFDRFSEPHRQRLLQSRERSLADAADWSLRDEMERQLAAYRQAVAAFLQAQEERFDDAGLPIEPLLDLISESVTTWAHSGLSLFSETNGRRLRAFSPEAQAFLGSAAAAPWKVEAPTSDVVFDDGMLEVARAGDPPRLLLSGEIDVSNADSVAAVLAAETAVAEGLAVDVSGLLFCDLAGLRAVLSALQRLAGRPAMRLYGVSHQLRRTMELAGLSLPVDLHVVAPETSSG